MGIELGSGGFLFPEILIELTFETAGESWIMFRGF